MFDIYKDIFDLPSKRKVKSTTPIDGHKYHKFGYLIIDSSYQAATEVMILPYLHDRKIYLSKNSNYCDYFFTSMRVNDYDYNDYHKELRHGVSKNLANSIFMKQNTRKWEARGEKKFAFEK